MAVVQLWQAGGSVLSKASVADCIMSRGSLVVFLTVMKCPIRQEPWLPNVPALYFLLFFCKKR